MKEKKQEELQSRREFFKSAAKAALPVLGAVVMSSLPIVKAEAAATNCTGGGCYGGCSDGCYGGCQGTCEGNCNNSCKGTCKGTCKQKCANNCGSCRNGCYASCTGGNYGYRWDMPIDYLN